MSDFFEWGGFPVGQVEDNDHDEPDYHDIDEY